MPNLLLKSGIIHPKHPINWQHSLNRNRLFWGMVLPHRMGGAYLRDLVGQHHCELRTANDKVTDWSPPIHSGDWGSLRCNANDSGARVETLLPLEISAPFTTACWVKSIGAPTANATIFGVSHNTAASSPFASYGMFYNSSSRVVSIGNTGGGFYSTQSGANMDYTHLLNGARLLMVQDGTNQTLYLNGVLWGTAARAVGTPTYGSTASVTFGEFFSVTRNPNLYINDGCIWSRALTAQDALMDWKLSLQGYPGVLRRLNSRRLSPEVVAAAGGNPWYYYSMLQGV